jgi:hypothetical protein
MWTIVQWRCVALRWREEGGEVEHEEELFVLEE